MSTDHTLVLASASPRRRELIATFGVACDVVPSTVSEAALIATLGPTAPSDFVQILARAKAEEVRRRSAPESVVVGADTIVVIDGDILGKPTGVEDAVLMLQRLSGRTHQVYTGVAVIAGAGSTITRAASTDVTFFELPDVDIQNYVATGEPMDKAGSYGIQEIGKRLVKNVSGDYFNVVGLPLVLLRELLLPYFPDLQPAPDQPVLMHF